MKSRKAPIQKTTKPDENYCRRCMKNKKKRLFYTATDKLLDSNGLMSICKDCINKIYDLFYINEQDVGRAILRLCRTLNVKFDPSALSALQKEIITYQESGRNLSAVFGIYKAKLVAVTSNKIGDRDYGPDFTFHEPSRQIIDEVIINDDGKDLKYFESMWGKGLTLVDYEYLEHELGEWKRTTKCDTHPEEVLLKQICYIENDIRKKRIEGKSVSSDLKMLRETMKSGGLTPVQQSEHKTGKSMDAFGPWIKDIEKLTPAEWHAQQEKYRDMDGIDEDLADITRSIRNFMTESRDFGTIQLEELRGVVPENALKSTSSTEELEDG